MKKIFLITTLILCKIFSITAQEESTTFDLTVVINGIENDKGKIYLAIYDSEETFLTEVEGIVAAIKDRKSVGIFKGLRKGVYAISLFHDENDNKKMDTKIFGIPKEPYGFSNNVKLFMGPPKFKDVKFSLESDKTISIRVK